MKPYMKPLGYVSKGLRELYGYPEKLTGREAYKTAWHLARLIDYQRYELGWSKLKTWQEYKKACESYGITRELAYHTRLQLWERSIYR